jgi:hypothetical protein
MGVRPHPTAPPSHLFLSRSTTSPNFVAPTSRLQHFSGSVFQRFPSSSVLLRLPRIPERGQSHTLPRQCTPASHALILPLLPRLPLLSKGARHHRPAYAMRQLHSIKNVAHRPAAVLPRFPATTRVVSRAERGQSVKRSDRRRSNQTARAWAPEGAWA